MCTVINSHVPNVGSVLGESIGYCVDCCVLNCCLVCLVIFPKAAGYVVFSVYDKVG